MSEISRVENLARGLVATLCGEDRYRDGQYRKSQIAAGPRSDLC